MVKSEMGKDSGPEPEVAPDAGIGSADHAD